MKNESTQDQDVQTVVAAGAKRGISRRSLLRAGTAATPVLLTFASGPVAAVPFGQCVLASSFVSVATFQSRNPNATTIGCATRNLDYWRNQAETTPVANPAAGLDLPVSHYLGGAGSAYDSQTVRSVLLASAGGPTTLGSLGTVQHLLAMALNLSVSAMPSSGGFDAMYLKTIWANYNTNGMRYKLLASNIDWGDAEIIAWSRLLLGYPLPP